MKYKRRPEASCKLGFALPWESSRADEIGRSLAGRRAILSEPSRSTIALWPPKAENDSQPKTLAQPNWQRFLPNLDPLGHIAEATTCAAGSKDMKPPLVQLALDFATVDEALKAAEIGVRAGVDILEAGTPLIVSEGVRCVGAIVAAFPQMPVLADFKTMDSGFKNVLLTKAQGGHYMTVCANAPDETVLSAIRQGKESGIYVVADTIGVKDQTSRARQCAAWGVDMIYLHYGADQRRADASRDTNQWVQAVRDVIDVPIGVATFGVDDAIVAARHGAALVAIGHPVVGTDEAALDRLAAYVQQVKATGGRGHC
jgi:3-hexulose-6-phosphate synthase/6-phospho-3-hexuloisomerase